MKTDDSVSRQPLLALSRISVRFGSQFALRDISLVIAPGETLAVIGESGCGKTVLLKTIVSLIRPSAGTVHFEGNDLSRLPERSLAKLRLRFGFVFQGAALFDSMSVYENVAFPLREHRRLAEPEIRRFVNERLAEVGLPRDVVQKMPAELSGGMKKRVGLARAIALDPEIMLYDEPTTGLDPIMSDVINELILSMRRHRPVTSVVVTHDMKSALKIATRIIMLYPVAQLSPHEPQIVFDGTPQQVASAENPRVTQFVRGEARDRLVATSADG